MAVDYPATPPRPCLAPALPLGAGVSLKAAHYEQARSAARQPAFLEIHAENYLHPGGPAHRHLESIRARHRLSIHGVGLSLGGFAPPSREALRMRRALIDRYQPDEFSEHLAWSEFDGLFLNDLLPLAYTRESLARVVGHVQCTQEALGRRILLENPATYVQFESSSQAEPEFLAEVIRRTGCGLLLDVNNVVVSATNHGFDAREYLHALPLDQVGEIHLAGHAMQEDAAGCPVLIDSHDGPVQPVTAALYAEILQRTGPVPTLIEWDANLPAWEVLLEQASAAESRIRHASEASVHATC